MSQSGSKSSIENDVIDRLVSDIDGKVKQIENIQKNQIESKSRNYFQHVSHQLKTKPYQTLGVLFWTFGAIAGVMAIRYDWLYKYYHQKFSTEIEEFREERERLSDEIFHLRDQIKKLKNDIRSELPHSLDMKTLRDNVMISMGFQRRAKVDDQSSSSPGTPPAPPPPNPSMIV
eukprot:TRINITY_DN3786_c0_g1_i11.p1 TRINITY_DN3786_c0_g1~~TRINITY_DN3786_c0_g1_i11.p1  ORF type:complete len:174 (-),score=11.94 TRINITY_DN3786_c0_g1_i11:585-1106(-)